MRVLIVSFVSLSIGLGIGWYLEHRRAEGELTDVVERMQQPMESSDREKAARAVRVIELMQLDIRACYALLR